jgi:pimeloyl-ACP methyl ester carboxylesterase
VSNVRAAREIGNGRTAALRSHVDREVVMPRALLVLALLPFSFAAAQRVSPPATVQELLIPVATAESLRVTTAGTGETVVLLPGLFGSAFGYRHLLELLPAAGYHALVVEPLGIGRSPRPEHADYSLTAQADRVAAVLERLHEGPVMVVAHSVGASMALRLAYRHPELVSSLVLLDGGPAEEAATPGFRRAMRYAPWIKWMGGVKRIRPKMRKDLIAASGDTSWVTEEVMNGYIAGATADLDGTLLAFLAMSEARESERLAPHLAEIRCPVRLVLGTAPHQGGVAPKQVALLGAHLALFAIDSVPGAGQYLFEEQPASVVSIISSMMPPTPTALGVAGATR